MPAHPHAELMALYAKDATETDEPWQLWEWFNVPANSWVLCKRNPAWMKGQKYRRKPKRSWYRVCLLKKDVSLVCTNLQEDWVTSHVDFVRWLTDRVYYDVK